MNASPCPSRRQRTETRKDWPAAAATRRVRSGGQRPPTSRHLGASSGRRANVERDPRATANRRYQPFVPSRFQFGRVSPTKQHVHVLYYGRRVGATRENGQTAIFRAQD